MTFSPHHHKALQAARDHLGSSIVYLQSAAERMIGDDWIDAMMLQARLEVLAQELGRVRTAAQERFDEFVGRDDFDDMKNGRIPYPDQRPRDHDRTPHKTAYGTQIPPPPTTLFPNAATGEELVRAHGGVVAALAKVQPNGHEADCIKAYQYVRFGVRPEGWVPPTAYELPDPRAEEPS